MIFAEVSAQVEDRQRGRALGWVMSGQSLALVVGVPLAAAIGSMTGWRGWFLCVVGIAAGRSCRCAPPCRAAGAAGRRHDAASVRALSARVSDYWVPA